MESKIVKVKANLPFVKKTAKIAVEQAKLNPNYKDLTLEDIEALQLSAEENVSNEVSEAIRTLTVAYLYLDKCGVKHVTERLRPGYVGMEYEAPNGAKTYQMIRGVPYGTLVSIPTDNGKSVVGINYIDKADRFATPVVGEYLALKEALRLKGEGMCGYDKNQVRKEAKAQIEHFYKRSLAYWNPSVYSHSRGTDPVKYSNFDKIHKNQLRILGKDKVRDMATRPSPKLVKGMTYKGDVVGGNEFLISNPSKNDFYIYSE